MVVLKDSSKSKTSTPRGLVVCTIDVMSYGHSIMGGLNRHYIHTDLKKRISVLFLKSKTS